MRLSCAVVWLALLLDAAVVHAQLQPGSIEGNVVERDTGVPIAGRERRTPACSDGAVLRNEPAHGNHVHDS
jgi:hypothetical protein